MSDSSRTVEQLKTLLRSWEGLDAQQMVKFYDGWAETYEQDLGIINYRAPNLVVDFLMEHHPAGPEDALVLDVACGSGLGAKLMFEQGFRHFVGVDGSEVMLQKAAESGLYQDLRLALLGTEPLPAQTGVFDVVVIIGALREDHVPVSIIRELLAAAKPGGHICMSRVDTKTEGAKKYIECLEKELQQLEAEGRWTHVDTRDMDKYMMDFYSEQYLSGTMYLYRKLQDA
ncbi:methyltransferase-like protein 27 [Centropristis striata]|uniref:methyltransferase-like protein 27 n=1 Tax=Centropristis striata TaxID=184440 RepID=UPI0027DF6C20|nr:methyltransferase-like protein 27 [Centropristis striata]